MIRLDDHLTDVELCERGPSLGNILFPFGILFFFALGALLAVASRP